MTELLRPYHRLHYWILSILLLFFTVASWETNRSQTPNSFFSMLQTGHTALVVAVALSPDNRFVVTASHDGTIKFWDRRTRLLTNTVRAHVGGVNALSFSPDGRFVASGGSDGVVRLWNAQSAKLERSYEGHTNPITCLAFSSDGELLASGSGIFGDVPGVSDNTIRLWETRTARTLNMMRGHRQLVTSVAFDESGSRIVSGSTDKTVRIWSVSKSEPLITISTDAFSSATFSPDGKMIASCAPEKIVFWDTNSGQQRSSISHKSYSTEMAFTADWRIVLIGDKLYDVKTGILTKSLRIYGSASALSQDGTLVVSAGPDQLRITEINTDSVIQDFEAYATPHYTTGLSVSKNGDSIAWAGVPIGKSRANYNDDIYVWNLRSGELSHSFSSNTKDFSQVNETVFANDEKTLLSCGTNGIDMWSLVSNRLISNLYSNKNVDLECESMAFSPDGGLLAAAGSAMSKVRLEAQSGQHDYALGKLSIHIFDTRTWRLIRTIPVPCANLDETVGEYRKIGMAVAGDPISRIHSIAFSPDGKSLVSGDDCDLVRVWDVQKGALKQSMSGHSRGVNSVTFDTTGKKIVSASFDDSIKVWDTRSGRLLKTLQGHRDSVSTVKTISENMVASGSYDQTIRLWNLDTGVTTGILDGHTGAITFLAISPDGKNIFSGSTDGLINLWSVNQSSLVSSIFIPNEGGWLNFSPDGFFSDSRDASKYLALREMNRIAYASNFRSSQLNPKILLDRFNGSTSSPIVSPPAVPVGANQGIAVSESDKLLRESWKNHKWFALVIGNDKYKNLEPLENSVNDAVAVTEILREKYGFYVRLLKDATKEQIMDELQFFERLATEDSSFLIYYAGHGVRISDIKKTYWQPIDADPTNRNQWVSSDSIYDSLELNKARHILIVSDSCFAGGLKERGGSVPAREDEPTLSLLNFMSQKSRTLIASGGLGPVDDGGAEGHSVFGDLFITGLKEMRPNAFSADLLFYTYIRNGVLNRAQQTPEIDDVLYRKNEKEDGKFVFFRH
jgi:WD40 repeat protein